MALRVFTVLSGSVEEGAEVGTFLLTGAGVKIPAIVIGEDGLGRSQGVLPVMLMPGQYEEWQEKGCVRIAAAELGQTKAGKPKLLARKEADADERIICVFRTSIGFRGSNEHTGDRTGVYVKALFGEVPTFHMFPGEILVTGTIVQGDEGREGSGDQIVAVMPKSTVFCTQYFGRLYGAPDSHYYRWDGVKLLSATWEEREVSVF